MRMMTKTKKRLKMNWIRSSMALATLPKGASVPSRSSAAQANHAPPVRHVRSDESEEDDEDELDNRQRAILATLVQLSGLC